MIWTHDMCRLRIHKIKIGRLEGFKKIEFGNFIYIKKIAERAKIPLNLTSEGLKCPPGLRVEHKIYSAICRTPVQAILEQKN